MRQEVKIKLHSSNNPRKESAGETLAPKTLLEALQDFANSGTEQEQIDYFRKRWPGFLDCHVYTGEIIHVPYHNDPGDPPEVVAEQEKIEMWRQFKKYRDEVRAAWTGNEAVLGSLLTLGIEEYKMDTRNVLVPDWRRSSFRYIPRTAFQAALYELLKHSRQARICANADCANPYFIATDHRLKFCSPECTQPAQKEWRRRWWEQHGQQWREQRSKKRTKSTKRRPRHSVPRCGQPDSLSN